MRTERSVEIDRPIEDVFQLTNDHVADWSIIVSENEMLNETEEVVGSTFRTVTEDHGQWMEFQGEVTEYNPPYQKAIFMTGPSFDLEVDYTFEPINENRTRVTQHSRVFAKGVFRIILFFAGWMMRRASCDALDRELNSLKQFCESRVPA